MKQLENSGYTGTPVAWLNFLTAWQKAKGQELDVDRAFNLNAYVESFPIDAPASYKHFMAAWEAIGRKMFVPVITWSNEDFFDFKQPQEVNVLALCHSIGKYVIGEKWEETIPELLASAEYRVYTPKQEEPLSPAYFCSWVVADYQCVGGAKFLLLNPLVRTPDGEWEAAYFDTDDVYATRFLSFADLMVHLYVNDVVNSEDMSWHSHKEDPTGLSKILFG